MKFRMEHANLHVRHFDEAVRFLKTAFPDFYVRNESVSDGLRCMHIGTDETYIALTETYVDPDPNSKPYDGKPVLIISDTKSTTSMHYKKGWPPPDS